MISIPWTLDSLSFVVLFESSIPLSMAEDKLIKTIKNIHNNYKKQKKIRNN